MKLNTALCSLKCCHSATMHCVELMKCSCQMSMRYISAASFQCYPSLFSFSCKLPGFQAGCSALGAWSLCHLPEGPPVVIGEPLKSMPIYSATEFVLLQERWIFESSRAWTQCCLLGEGPVSRAHTDTKRGMSKASLAAGRLYAQLTLTSAYSHSRTSSQSEVQQPARLF